MNTHPPFDEIRLIVFVPSDLEEAACQATERVLESRPSHSSLHSAVRKVVRQYADLNMIQDRISK